MLEAAQRQLYAGLAIFKEDEPIPGAAVTQLWWGLEQLDAGASISLLRDMADRALLQRIDDCDGEIRVVVHDLLRDLMLADAGAAGLQRAHQALLDGYRRTQAGSAWHTAPDDGYLYDHLAYHLYALGCSDAAAAQELEALFAAPDWMHARAHARLQVRRLPRRLGFGVGEHGPDGPRPRRKICADLVVDPLAVRIVPSGADQAGGDNRLMAS